MTVYDDDDIIPWYFEWIFVLYNEDRIVFFNSGNKFINDNMIFVCSFSWLWQIDELFAEFVKISVFQNSFILEYRDRYLLSFEDISVFLCKTTSWSVANNPVKELWTSINITSISPSSDPVDEKGEAKHDSSSWNWTIY